ncbi:unnamed protein product [Rangifer tarandus platyrhynchus]|uniref:Uncharacterized protein n=1 Tax=Rangifer tarandus platyrhynchus TaxID=3082113 RepID=A0AC59ZFM8_RANTA
MTHFRKGRDRGLPGWGFKEMKTHSDGNFHVLECRSVRKRRKYGNNAAVYCASAVYWVPSDRRPVSDPSPGSQQRASRAPEVSTVKKRGGSCELAGLSWGSCPPR